LTRDAPSAPTEIVLTWPTPVILIASLAREAQLQQLSTIDGLDAKGGSLIGFAGVVLGLLFTALTSTSRWNWAMTAGASLIVVSVVPLAIALFPAQLRVQSQHRGS
jgi:hypothetical protein